MVPPNALPDPGRRLLLMRHGVTEDFRLGHADRDRRLTLSGVQQLAQQADFLTEQKFTVDQVLCSTALRTRQTADQLNLNCPIDYQRAIYNADPQTLLALIQEVDPERRTVLMIGHAPGIPGLVQQLADNNSTAALAVIIDRFPPGTLVAMQFSGAWNRLTQARATVARIPS